MKWALLALLLVLLVSRRSLTAMIADLFGTLKKLPADYRAGAAKAADPASAAKPVASARDDG